MNPRSLITVAAQQIALAAAVFVLVVAWLQIPDANAFEVIASILVAVLIAVVAGAGETAIALRLTGKPLTKRALLLGAAIVAVAIVFLWLVSLGVDRVSSNDGLWAGYLNSRAPRSLRNVLSYAHIVLWTGWLWTALCFLVEGLIAAAAFAFITSARPARGIAAILRSVRYWLSFLLFAVVATAVTDALLNWTPGHGLRVESLSLAFRLALAILLNAAAAALLLQAMASAVRTHSGGTPEPVLNHRSTADIP